VKRDFGDDNFAIVEEFITFFVRGKRRHLFAHIDAGHSTPSNLSPPSAAPPRSTR
jgi:hypothetical protein